MSKVEIIKPDRRQELKRIADSASTKESNGAKPKRLKSKSRKRNAESGQVKLPPSLPKSVIAKNVKRNSKRTPKLKHIGITEIIEDLAAKMEDELVDAAERFVRGIFG